MYSSDGKYDLYVGSTDRCVGVYRWNEDTKKLDMRRKFSLPGQVWHIISECVEGEEILITLNVLLSHLSLSPLLRETRLAASLRVF